MAKPFDSGSDPDDILSLIADVHTDTPAEQDRLEQALKTLESTHRHASAAMQRFERTGRVGPHSPAPAPAGSLLAGPSAGLGVEPKGRAPDPQADSSIKTPAPVSTEVTQMGPIPRAPPPAYPPAARSEEPTRTAIAKPQKPIAVAEVLSGRGAEFTVRGHTKTHIVHPKKNLPKK